MQLKDVQVAIDSDPHNNSLRVKEAKLVEEFCEADEEKLLYQQASIKWLNEGDRNSKFFHKVLKGRSNRSKVHSLIDDNGIIHEEDQIPQLFLKHFERFLGQSCPVQAVDDSESLFQRRLSTEEAGKLVREITNEEIKAAMFDINDAKAPGPCGFSSDFFKRTWSTIGSDICKVVKEFFDSGKMLKEINATLITLIPKVQTPSKVTDSRHIACCNVLYKCISKIISNRIKPALGGLVSCNQSAFIPGRHIQDNIMLTQEIMRSYNRKGGPKRVAFKIDIQKAYDTVNWGFLNKVLEGFGFHEKMVHWIMEYVITNAFTLNVNGERIGFFKGGRSLRQGDPMSPYLFTLIMEIFTLILGREIDQDQLFQFHFGCKAIKLSHVCFADDLLVMCHGDKTYVQVIKKARVKFSNCSGLLPNYSKSTVFFGSLNDDQKNTISEVLPFVVGKLPVRYLGVPLIAKRLSVKECGCLLDKINARVKNWKNRCLSYVGRLQLTVVVLESIHVYWASVFLIPSTIIKEINKLLKNFLWNQGEIAKGKAKVAWANICRPKDQGGLGLKDLKIWNKALLAKHIWNYAVKRGTLWVKWVHIVKLRGRSIWSIEVDKSDSWGWKNLLGIRDLIRENMFHEIGNGKSTSLWYDRWSNIGPLSQFVTHGDIYAARLNEELKLCDMINNGSWLWPEEWYEKFPTITNLTVPFIDEDCENKIIWKNCRGKEVDFSVSIVNSDLNNHVQSVDWWQLVWYSQCIPKHTFILWLTIQDRLTTQDKLMKWGVQGANRCSLCQKDSEDLQHLFFLCTFSSEV